MCACCEHSRSVHLHGGPQCTSAKFAIVCGENAGDRALEKAGLKLLKQMLWKVANPMAGSAQAKLSFKLDLEASDQVNKLSCLVCLLCYADGLAFMQLAFHHHDSRREIDNRHKRC